MDNLLFIMQSPEHVGPFLEIISSSMSPYRGKVEEISSNSISFLDVSLIKHRIDDANCGIRFSPIFRAKGPILAHSSDHPAMVHVDWPLSYLHTLWTHSSDLEAFHVAKHTFLERLRNSFVSKSFVDFVDRHTAYIQAHKMSVCETWPSNPLQVWVPFVHHPLWQHNGFLSKIVRRHVSSSFNEYLLRTAFAQPDVIFDAFVAWKIATRPFGNSLINWA